MKKKSPWSRNDKLAAAAVVVAVLAIVVGLLFPEVRRTLGLEKPAPLPVAPALARIPKSEVVNGIVPATATPNVTTQQTPSPLSPVTKKREHRSAQSPTAPVPTPPSPMSQECAPGASCAMSNGQQGGITAGTYIGHVDPPPRKLSPEQTKDLRDAVAGHPAKLLVLYMSQDTEAYQLGVQIQDALVAEGWTPAQGVTGMMSSSASGPLYGITISRQGTVTPPGSPVRFDQSTPWGALSLQLQRDFPEDFYVQPGDMGTDKDRVMIRIYANPKSKPSVKQP